MASGADYSYYYVEEGEDVDPAMEVHLGPLEITDNHSLGANNAPVSLIALNRERALDFLPVIVFLLVCLVCGLLGNGLVCYVFRCRLRRTTCNYFILFMAVLDILACGLVIPFHIVVASLPYVFDAMEACKLGRFLESASVSSAGLTLVFVALDRYYKLCKPDEAFSLCKARVLSTVAVVVAAVVAVPALVLFGSNRVPTSVPGLNGTACGEDDRHGEDTAALLVYYIALMATFVFTLVSLTTVYLIIGCHLWCCRAPGMGEELPPRRKEYPKKHRFVSSDSTSSASSLSKYGSSFGEENRRSGGAVTSASSSLRKSASQEDARRAASTPIWRQQSQPQPRRTESQRLQMQRTTSAVTKLSIKATRITLIFFLVSLIYVLCFLPFVVAHVLKVTGAAFGSLSPSQRALELIYQFCVHVFLVSHVVKPIMYGVFYPNFRRECKYVFKKLCRACIKR